MKLQFLAETIYEAWTNCYPWYMLFFGIRSVRFAIRGTQRKRIMTRAGIELGTSGVGVILNIQRGIDEVSDGEVRRRGKQVESWKGAAVHCLSKRVPIQIGWGSDRHAKIDEN